MATSTPFAGGACRGGFARPVYETIYRVLPRSTATMAQTQPTVPVPAMPIFMGATGREFGFRASLPVPGGTMLRCPSPVRADPDGDTGRVVAAFAAIWRA